MKSIYSSACLYFLLAGLTPCSKAQSRHDDPGVLLNGTVETGGAPAEGLVVVLSSSMSFDRRADVQMGGEFQFFDIPGGEYQLSVTTATGAILHRQYVSLRSQANQLSVHLPPQGLRLNRSSAATVSVAKLLHKVPSNARKEFEKGMKAADKNDSADAIGHLARAVELDPGFVEAQNNLGIQHLNAEATETARSYFEKAIQLDPGAPEAHINLSLALLRLQQYVEAEPVARVAVRLAGNDAASHYYLGIALLGQDKNPSEAVDSLERSCDTIPRAHLAIAIISEKSGNLDRAKKELRVYLKVGAPEDRQYTEEWLADLQLRTPAQQAMTDPIR